MPYVEHKRHRNARAQKEKIVLSQGYVEVKMNMQRTYLLIPYYLSTGTVHISISREKEQKMRICNTKS